MCQHALGLKKAFVVPDYKRIVFAITGETRRYLSWLSASTWEWLLGSTFSVAVRAVYTAAHGHRALKAGPPRGWWTKQLVWGQGLWARSWPSQLSLAPAPGPELVLVLMPQQPLASKGCQLNQSSTVNSTSRILKKAIRSYMERPKSKDGRNCTRAGDGQKYNYIPEKRRSSGKRQKISRRKWGTGQLGKPEREGRASGFHKMCLRATPYWGRHQNLCRKLQTQELCVFSQQKKIM